MPAWTPEAEGLAPYDDEDELRADLPAELGAFLQQFDIQKQFTVEIKKWSNEAYAGRCAVVGRMEAMIPNYDSVVRINGPGYYGFDTTWTPKGGKARHEMFRVSLVGAYWTDIHEKAKKEKRELELEEAKHQAEIDRAKAGGAGVGSYADPAKSGREYMKSMLGDMKDLATVFGLGDGIKLPGMGGGGDMNMGMMFMGMMQMMMKQSENSTNLLITVMAGQNKGQEMKETMGMFRDMMTMRDGLMPKETHWIESVVGAISDNLGPLAGLFMRGNPVDDPLHQKMNEGLAETREKAQEDPRFLKSLVRHMDAKVGPKMTDKILNGFLDVKRPSPAGAKKPTQPAEAAQEGPGNPSPDQEGAEGDA